jgi:P pilus assembly chaperone PapD
MSSTSRTLSQAGSTATDRSRSRLLLGKRSRAAVVRPIALALALALTGVGLPRAAAAQQLAVDQIELFLTPGDPARGSAVFNVTNEGNAALQATLYTSDWDRDSVGNTRTFAVGTIPESCRDKVQIFPTQLQLEPHSQQAVRVTLVDGDTVSRACWSIVFVELRNPVRMQVAGRAIQAIVRVGTKIYVEPRTAQRSGDIVDMRVLPHVATAAELAANTAPDTTTRDLLLVFKNTGGMQIRPNGRVELRRPDNSVAATVHVDEFPILPGATEQVRVPIPTLASGKYIALAILDFGGADIAGGQVEIQMP